MSEQNGDETLRFQAKRVEKKVEIEMEDGSVEKFTIREMMGTTREEWMNENAKRLKITPDGRPVGIQEFKDLFPSLICRCMYDKEDVLLSRDYVRKNFKSSLQQKLFEVCRNINGLEEPEEVKKD